jgi:asparagine synthase (glutamine-hydrolysing)
MCGIAGILDFTNGFRREELRQLKRMADSILHRGPDDVGFVLLGCSGTPASRPLFYSPDFPADKVDLESYKVGLANRRLSILDLSVAGRMPMCNEDGSIWITYNGEIYNYSELAHELKQKGHQFRSSSDTEVILHAYEEWGVSAVTRFNGMWAFALWDANRDRLLLSRDRFGVKPLYFHMDRRRLIFASEVKAIRAAGIEPGPNLPYLEYFLQNGVMCDGEETFYADIKQLMPSHSLIVTGSGKTSFDKYWTYPGHSASTSEQSDKLIGQFKELFKDAVRMRLRSDVPVGACLSGGLDSTSIATMCRMVSPGTEFHTFSVLFDEEQYNETDNMEAVLKSIQVHHHYIRATAGELIQSVPRIVQAMDGPHLSASTYPYWLMLTKVKECVKVLMDGQGADELLAGYGIFQIAWLDSAIRATLRKGTIDPNLFQGIRDIVHGTQLPAGVQIGYWLRENYKIARHLQNRLWPHRRIFNAPVEGIDTDRCYLPLYSDDPLKNWLYQWHSSRVLPGLLQYGDALSMSSSVEVRQPFMDYRLVEFVFGLPYAMIHSGLESKFVLRKAMDGILPDTVRNSRKKIGFRTPLSDWLRNSLREPVRDILLSRTAKLRSLLDYEILEAMLDRHLQNHADESSYLWRYLLTEEWLQSGHQQNIIEQ